MSFFDVVFYLFASITTLAAMGVIVARNPVHAALFLVLAFCSAAGIWMLLEAEFLAIVLVLVYVRCGDGVVPVRGDDAGY